MITTTECLPEPIRMSFDRALLSVPMPTRESTMRWATAKGLKDYKKNNPIKPNRSSKRDKIKQFMFRSMAAAKYAHEYALDVWDSSLWNHEGSLARALKKQQASRGGTTLRSQRYNVPTT